MFLKKKNNFKPFYKQFIRLKENVQNRKKIFHFNKKKWKFFIQNYKKKLKRYNKFKPNTQIQYTVSKFSNKKTSYQKRYLNTLQSVKLLKLFYGGLRQKTLKKKINLTSNLLFLEILERRLDTILYRAKFSSSMRNSRQLISHGKIFVNGKKINSCSFIINVGDLITVDLNYHYLIRKNFKEPSMWPIPSKHLIINYRTLQITLGNIKDIVINFNINLNLERITNY